MNLKEIANRSVYGTTGYISSFDTFSRLEPYIIYNLPVFKEYKQIIVANNYADKGRSVLMEYNSKLWKRYFPDCIIIDSVVNRGHSIGTADLDNMVFDYCKINNIEWLCKSDSDVILQESLLNTEIEEADLYYINGISYEDLYLNNFNYETVYEVRFSPQTFFYFLNVSRCDYLTSKEYLDSSYAQTKQIPNYNGRIWDYIPGWGCEALLKDCVKRNNLSKYYLLDKDKHNTLCEAVNMYKIGDPSHKNIMINGICHFQYPEQQIIEI
jgi:hypothetical protein